MAEWAYALALIVPYLWAGHSALGIVALSVLFSSGRAVPFLGGVLGCALMRPWKGWLWVTLPALLVLHYGTWGERVRDRWGLYWQALLDTLHEPILGYGWDPLSVTRLAQAHAWPLPSVHSDWLALAFHGGWVVTWIVICAVTLVLYPWSRHPACVGLIVAAAMACFQDVLSKPGALLVVGVLWVIWCRQKESKHA